MAHTTDSAPHHIGAKVIDSQGHAVGKVANVFYDERTLEPGWISVDLGLLHRATPLVPLEQAYFADTGHLVVAVTEDLIKHAPAADEAAPTMTEAEELAQYYGLGHPNQS